MSTAMERYEAAMERRRKRPCAFSRVDNTLMTYGESESRLDEIITIDKLADDQKRELVIASWTHEDDWSDIFIGEQVITKEEAIAAINQHSELGKKLLQFTLLGFEHTYDGLLKNYGEDFPPPQVIPSPNTISAGDTENYSFEVVNNLPKTIYIYTLVHGRTVEYNVENKKTKTLTGYVGQGYWACTKKWDGGYKYLLGTFRVSPGCLRWKPVVFPTDAFLPSMDKSKSEGKTVTITITNKLKTWVKPYCVLPNGKMHPIFSLGPGSCYGWSSYIGQSFVALNQSTVLSTFFVDSALKTEWTMEQQIPSAGEEIYAKGENGYVFYQVHTERDDIQEPSTKSFTKSVTVNKGTKYLYAGVFESADIHFKLPDSKDLKITIESTDSSGNKKVYDTDTNTKTEYILMSTENLNCLRKFCIKDPTPGTWTITINTATNIGTYFQFQTIPSSDPYLTMKKTLSPDDVLGAAWENIAYKGFASFISSKPTVEGGELGFPFLIPLLVALAAASLTANVIALYNLEADKTVESKTNALSEAAQPPPKDLPKILLTDADDDESNKDFYKSRAELYQAVREGEYRDSYSKLVGKDDTREKFMKGLKESANKVIFAAGHGNEDTLGGFKEGILTKDDVNENPSLAKGKIFHLTTCSTGENGGLGDALIKNGAVAFIGYDSLLHGEKDSLVPTLPDCEIDLKLLDGKTVEEAYNYGKSSYRQRMNDPDNSAVVNAALLLNRAALVKKGNGNATIKSL